LRSPCPLRSLELTGGGRSQLKQDILPLLAVLATNTTLTSLDITGHLMGNKGATALGKALQTNISLTKLLWDDNGTTLPGFAYFRIGMRSNQQVTNMPMPYNDILNCTKPNNWEGNNDKLVQAIKDIEGYLQRNLALASTNTKPKFGFLTRSSNLGTVSETNKSYKEMEQWIMSRGGGDDDDNYGNENETRGLGVFTAEEEPDV